MRLCAINDVGKDPSGPTYSDPLTPDFLEAHSSLVVDTAHFPADFTLRLLAAVGEVQDRTDGLLVCSENFQALSLMTTCYRARVKCIYIDPPYNTDASAIVYKNDYKSSSWISLIGNRLRLARKFLRRSGVLCVAIDDEQAPEARRLIGGLLEKELGVAAVRSNPQSRKSRETLSPSHEYALFYGSSSESRPGSLELTAKRLARYPLEDDKGRYSWMSFIRTGTNDRREDRPKLFYPIFVAGDNSIRIPSMKWSAEVGRCGEWTMQEQPRQGEVAVYPISEGNGGKVEKRWHRGWERFVQEPDEYRARRDVSGKISIDFKTRIDETSTPSTWWNKNEYASANYGPVELKSLFGEKPFNFPKALALVEDCIRTANVLSEGLVLDYFAGSGTTAHAVINLNREDGGTRRYIMVEMGDYFDTVLLPRIKKAVYSRDWKDGKPRPDKDGNLNGVSHCFKYLRLESYEDCLNNLELRSDAERDAALAENKELRREYTLKYMLDVETEGSASLLNVTDFHDPEAYTLKIKQPGTDEVVEKSVDLVETFNWLIGLHVELLDRPGMFTANFEREKDPELPGDSHTRLKVKGRLKEMDEGGWWFRIVDGYVRRTPGNDEDRDRVLVIWRKLTDDPEKDAAVLEALLDKYKVNQADTEFDTIYINGSHGLRLHGDAKARLMSLEETFHARMWDTEDV